MLLKCVGVLALLLGPIVSEADAITYDFTGVITNATGVYAGDTGIVNGTYTIDLDAANPLQSDPVSFTSDWQFQADGGSVFASSGAPQLPSGLVFSSTLSGGGGLSYSTPPIGGAGVGSDVQGYYVGPEFGAPNTYSPTESHYTSSTDYTESYFQLSGSTAPYTQGGLPIFSLATTAATGRVIDVSGSTSELQYNITSLTPASPVPEPALVWLMLSGLGGLGWVARNRSGLHLKPAGLAFSAGSRSN